MKYRDAKIEDIPKPIVEIVKKNAIQKEIENSEGEKKTITIGLKKGLLLTGPTGTGKTYILHAISNRLNDMRIKSRVEKWTELLLELREKEASGHIRTTLEYICDGVLMLDDVGSEVKGTEWVQKILYQIVDRCYEREIPLFIATNLGHEQFKEMYGDRIHSRVFGDDMFEKVELTGEDKRFKK